MNALFRRLELYTGNTSQTVFSIGNFTIDSLSRESHINGQLFEMTPTELALMVYMIQNSSRALSREELLKNVWKFDFEVDTRATDDVIKRLRKKLTCADCNVKIESVWGYGFKLTVEVS